MHAYLTMPTIGENNSPLDLWKANASSFPRLSILAKCSPALADTETSSERVFSIGGNTVTNKRTNLLSQRLREIIFCHDNPPWGVFF